MKRLKKGVAILLMALIVLSIVLPVRALDENTAQTEASETATAQTLETLPEQQSVQAAAETVPGETAAETVPEEEQESPAVPEPQETQPEETQPQETVPAPVAPDVPSILQTDFSQVPYGEGTVASNGSGITALAMVASCMTGHAYSPRTLAEYFGGQPGSEAQRLEYASDALRLPWYSVGDWQAARAALEAGCVIIAQMNGESIFTDSQHFIVLTGWTEDGRVRVNDPYGPHYGQAGLAQGFRDGFSGEQISTGFAAGWCYDYSVMPDEPYIYEEKPAKVDEMPLYDQTAYPDVLYGDGTIASSGCSIVSLAMVASYMTGHAYLPEELADYFGVYTGSNVERLEYAADMLRLPWRRAENWHDVERELKKGSVAIVLENGQSVFTQSQHFLVIRGLTEEGRVLVNDAYGPNYRKPELKIYFERGFASEHICAGYSGAWIFDVNAMPEEPFIYQEDAAPKVEPRYPELRLSDAEKKLLASMVWVEARGEEFKGQQAVAEVVLNRLASGKFQSTVRGVILAENQFRSADFLDEATPTQTQYEAVERALYGPYVLPADVMHFARYAVNKNVWGTIGGHVFCYQWD